MRSGSYLQPIIEDVTHRIVSGDYAAGHRLPAEAELQREWKVSRSVVREAMKVLASRGLVSVEQGRGTFVSEANHAPLQSHLAMTLRRAQTRNGAAKGAERGNDDLEHLRDVRGVLEVAVAERAARCATDCDIRELEMAIGAMRAGADSAQACADADFAFHRSLARAAGNPLWPAVLDSLNDLLRCSQQYGYLGRENALMTVREHEQILQAVRDRDVQGAADAMCSHLETSAKDVSLARRKKRS